MAEAPRDPKEILAEVFPDHPHLAGTLELIWRQAARIFPPAAREAWLKSCRQLAEGELGEAAALAYLRNAPASAAYVGPEAAAALARATVDLANLADRHAALAFLAAAPKAARRLGTLRAFHEWIRIVAQFATLAPESVATLLDRTESILAELDLRAYESWARSGVLSTADDPDRRLKFFSLVDPAARRFLAQEGDGPLFADVERRLKAYLQAVWGLRPPIRPAVATKGQEPPRRASFESGIIRMPDSFRGFAGERAVALFRASLAHIGAHLVFTRRKFSVQSLKPVQVALISLVEDARVEQLAMRRFPGLQRLWLPFHVAEPAGAITSAGLMVRLSRALLDPDYVDGHGWVRKGCELFFGQEERWEDQELSRSVGGLLGNDLGQMRTQFNARTYVVEPPYRDDNLGLWDFGAAGAQAEGDLLYESVRFDQLDDENREPERERERREAENKEAPNRAKVTTAIDDEEAGVPVARYPEWDYLIGRDRPDWATLVEFPGFPGSARVIDRVLESHAALVNRITTLIRSAKVSRPVRLRRQPEGDRLDLDACISAAVSRRRRETPDPHVYITLARRDRDLSTLVLLDVSQSTNDIVRGTETSVLTLERQGTALLAHAMAELGDPFAIHAFCSNGREEVRYYRIKEFGDPFDGIAKRRLAGLSGSLSTRIGIAIRHAGAGLSAQRSHRRLLLMVTDGEPSDVDVGDRRYLVEDARKAVLGLTHAGIDVFCVGLDAGGDSYLSRIFGRRNVLQIDRLESLPEKLPMLYLRLTA